MNNNDALREFKPDPLEQIIDNYIAEYEFNDGEAFHAPTEEERFMIKDAIMGLIADPEFDAEWGKAIDEQAERKAAALLAADKAGGDAIGEIRNGYARWYTLERPEGAKLYTKPQADKVDGEVVSAETLSKMFIDLEGIDKEHWGYHHAKGWNDALRRAMDYTHPQPQPSALPDDVVKDAEQAISFLELMFDAYEDGIDCYEYPEEYSGYLGKAFRLGDEDFTRIADFLNAKRPRAAMLKEGKDEATS